MAATRTQGITVDTDGNFTINKEYRGVRLFFRLGKLSQDQAEQRLHTEIDRVDCELERKAHARPRFAHCAARYLDESRDKRSFDVIALHVRLLISHLRKSRGQADPRCHAQAIYRRPACRRCQRNHD